jgi:hypothetical protein
MFKRCYKETRGVSRRLNVKVLFACFLIPIIITPRSQMPTLFIPPHTSDTFARSELSRTSENKLRLKYIFRVDKANF